MHKGLRRVLGDRRRPGYDVASLGRCWAFWAGANSTTVTGSDWCGAALDDVRCKRSVGI